MSMIKNILFIMADQLRWDYLSCYGHPHLHTPNIDKLAARGVRFDRAYVQSPVCGPSRASCYTGRTVFSHGATWNRVPLPVGELTLGDYLRPLGVRTAVVGKTHMVPDREGMARLGLNPTTELGMIISQPGFDPYERDDGLHPTPLLRNKGGMLRYNDWLREQGYEGENPWNDYANAADGPDGEILSGWHLKNSNLPARVKEEHSETAYMTLRAREFIEDSGDTPWLCHLSYIKPHWPYMAPAPYHDMYGPETFLPVVRSEKEREDPNPVFDAFMKMEVSEVFSAQGTRETVLPAYMGLIKQIDDHLGRLFDWLEETGKADETMIVLTSDHGDYLGDHWMGEKELFHEQSVRVPLIICDPRAEADATRGTACDALVEAIDLVPTFLEATGAPPADHRLEGRSLMPLLRGEVPQDWRDAVFSEIDYAFYAARETVGVGPSDARAYMLRTERWKYIHFRGFAPQLFDLEQDPDEFSDLGRHPDYETVRQEMHARLLDRLTARKNRVTMTDEGVRALRRDEDTSGIMIGKWG
ncbi:phosphonate monoester hydrolase [Pseudooceanicola lipolyticus]|uniref:Phosphonate monoester hydrolase n=1 Tax=Pseudooceanicola lipolyticus TaxID=2029104 RepID=A0A2M8J7C2_9RHOB|nr:alkaline phosphatase family protein [Pseudooceanicola lipolyticus]PJE38666.1 phosphonate monoester hydrolase [Pseudooceanicola lipolyticus]